MKSLLLILTILCLAGCQTDQPKIEYREKVVPVYKPLKLPDINCPPLQTDFLTPEQKEDAGELVKAFNMDAQIALLCLKQYREAHDKNNDLAEKGVTITPTNK